MVGVDIPQGVARITIVVVVALGEALPFDVDTILAIVVVRACVILRVPREGVAQDVQSGPPVVACRDGSVERRRALVMDRDARLTVIGGRAVLDSDMRDSEVDA